ncbi:MAG: endonuclease/exonuclease/phosphatase family protein [Akkermansia sp.]
MALFSFCTLLIFIVLYVKGINQTALLSIYPLWLWALFLSLPALFAWILFKTRLGLILFTTWTLFAVLTADFIPPVSRSGMTAYKLPLSPGIKYWRIMTLDCSNLDAIPVGQIAKLNTDLLFLQGSNDPNKTISFAIKTFGPQAQVRQMGTCAIIAANGQMGNAWSIPNTDGFIVDWIPLRSSLPIRLVNISLAAADNISTNFLRPSSWQYYAQLRAYHNTQLLSILNTLKTMGTQYGELPVILAGNFNAEPSSPIFRLLDKTFVDAYIERGTGYGATTPTNFPILRHDRIFSTAPLAPSSAKTVKISGTNHRAVIADMTKD